MIMKHKENITNSTENKHERLRLFLRVFVGFPLFSHEHLIFQRLKPHAADPTMAHLVVDDFGTSLQR